MSASSNNTPKCFNIFGKKCCWDSNIPCGPTCQMIWRIWITGVAVILFVYSIGEMIAILILLNKYWDNKEIFIVDRLVKVLMLNEGLFPGWMLASMLCVASVALWSMAIILRPTKVSHGGLVFYKITISIVTLSMFLGSIYQFVMYFLEWPDINYRHEVEMWMINGMGEGDPPNLISNKWMDTQDLYSCCGILSSRDWVTVISSKLATENVSSSEVLLPSSCCPSNIGKLCTEDSAWSNGCLAPQIDTLKDYSNFNVVSSSLMYFLLDALSTSVKSYFHKFKNECPEEEYESIPGSSQITPDSNGDPPIPNTDTVTTTPHIQLSSGSNDNPNVEEGHIGSAKELERKPSKSNTSKKPRDNDMKAKSQPEIFKSDYISRNFRKLSLPAILEGSENEYNYPSDASQFSSVSHDERKPLIPYYSKSKFNYQGHEDDSGPDEENEYPLDPFSTRPSIEIIKEIRSSYSQISIAAKDDLGILLPDKDIDNENENSMEMSSNSNLKLITPAPSSEFKRKHRLRSLTSSVFKSFPDWHTWKSLPSQGLNDS